MTFSNTFELYDNLKDKIVGKRFSKNRFLRWLLNAFAAVLLFPVAVALIIFDFYSKYYYEFGLDGMYRTFPFYWPVCLVIWFVGCTLDVALVALFFALAVFLVMVVICCFPKTFGAALCLYLTILAIGFILRNKKGN